MPLVSEANRDQADGSAQNVYGFIGIYYQFAQ
jgi:hypothetical protein